MVRDRTIAHLFLYVIVVSLQAVLVESAVDFFLRSDIFLQFIIYFKYF